MSCFSFTAKYSRSSSLYQKTVLLVNKRKNKPCSDIQLLETINAAIQQREVRQGPSENRKKIPKYWGPFLEFQPGFQPPIPVPLISLLLCFSASFQYTFFLPPSLFIFFYLKKNTLKIRELTHCLLPSRSSLLPRIIPAQVTKLRALLPCASWGVGENRSTWRG